MEKVQLSFKIIIVGMQASGKTSLAYNYVNGGFRGDYNVTIGVQFSSKTIQIENTQIQMQLWDTAGLQAFSSIVKTFYKGAAAAIVAFAIDDMKSFEATKRWVSEVKDYAHQEACIFLVGTKADLEEKRQVSQKQAQDYLREIGGFYYVETSAKTSQNVEQLFQRISNTLFKKYRVSPAFRRLVAPYGEFEVGGIRQTSVSFSLQRPISKRQSIQKSPDLKKKQCCNH